MTTSSRSATAPSTAKAKLTLKLVAESGFESEQEHQITVEQWGDLSRILNGESFTSSAATDISCGVTIPARLTRHLHDALGDAPLTKKCSICQEIRALVASNAAPQVSNQPNGSGNQPAPAVAAPTIASSTTESSLTFDAFRKANVTRCLKWHPAGIESWSPSDWLTAVTGELGELASLLKMRNRERDGLPGNKFSPTDQQIADEIADVLTYLDLLAAALDINLGKAAVEKFNTVSERVGFPDRISLASATKESSDAKDAARYQWLVGTHLRELLALFHTTDTSDVGLAHVIDEAIARREELGLKPYRADSKGLDR